MGGQPWFFDVEERLRELSAKGDDLERIAALVNFVLFRAEFERAMPRAYDTKGGRRAFDRVLMFQILLLAAMHGLSDERYDHLIKDRLSFIRILSLGLADPVPDANTIWAFREALKRAGAVERLFARFDATLREAGYKNHVAIERRHGLIRGWSASHAAAHGFSRAPLVMGLVLGQMVEGSLKQSLIILDQRWSVFLEYHVALTLLVVTVTLLLLSALLRGVRARHARVK